MLTKILAAAGGKPAEAIGQVQFTTATIDWVVPENVTSICAVCVGGVDVERLERNGTGGAALAYSNDIPVTAGESLTISIPAGGAASLLRGGNTLVKADYGRQNRTAGRASNSIGQVRRTGGTGALGAKDDDGDGEGGGGGGAAGYSSNGGNGVRASTFYAGKGGGGVGLFGGSSGGQGGRSTSGGSGGSGGTNGSNLRTGGNFGGGYGGREPGGYSGSPSPQRGAVRIIWGPDRAFPNTNTEDLNP